MQHIGGALPIGQAASLDLNGASDQLILDADADTTISADTDDQIDIKIAGADDFQFTANTFTAQSGSTITTPTLGVGNTKDLGDGIHIKISDTGASTNTGFDEIVIEKDSNCGISILSGNDDGGALIFGDDGDNDIGNIFYNHNGDYMAFNINAAERMRITSDGYVGINNTSPSATLEVHTNNNITAFETQPKVNQNYYAALFRNSSGNDVGNIESTASSTSFGTSSDYRLKENVDYTWDATTRLKQLKPARFNWIVDDTNTLVDGFLAHEVSSIVPEAISGEKDGTETRTKVVLDASGNQLARNVEEADWVKGKEDETFPSDSTWEASKVYPKHQSIDQSKLVPLMVKTIQELEARIKTLEDA
jgi:hypothetical protein